MDPIKYDGNNFTEKIAYLLEEWFNTTRETGVTKSAFERIAIALEKGNPPANPVMYNDMERIYYALKNMGGPTPPGPGPTPTGTITITENGTYDVRSYAYAIVNVPQPIPGKTVGKTTLYNDGTLIINEYTEDRTGNIAAHGAVTNEYDPLDADHPYVFTSMSDRPWNNERSSIKSVKFGSPIKPTSTAEWFEYLDQLTSIDFTNLDTSDTTDMNYMFGGCASLTSLDCSNFNTSNVTNMSQMFDGCLTLASLNVSSFDTSKVTNMSYLFSRCKALTSLDISNFDTSNVISMISMFSDSAYVTLDVSSFDTSKVEEMAAMFGGCPELTTIYVSSNFVTTSVIDDGESMFYDSVKLVGGQGTAYEPSNANMFRAHIDGGTANPGYFTAKPTPGKTVGKTTLYNDRTLIINEYAEDRDANIALYGSVVDEFEPVPDNDPDYDPDWQGSIFLNVKVGSPVKPASLSNWFDVVDHDPDSGDEYNPIQSIDLTNLDTINVTGMAGLFDQCSKLTSLDLSNFNTSNVVNMSGMFQGCSSLTSLDLSNFNTSNVFDMSGMFNGCSSLTSLNISSFDTSKVTSIGGMFRLCRSLTSLDLSSFDTSNVVSSMVDMFNGCTNLQTIYASANFITSQVINSTNMFNMCNNLVGGAGTTYLNTNPGKNKTRAKIDGGTADPGYFTAKP